MEFLLYEYRKRRLPVDKILLRLDKQQSLEKLSKTHEFTKNI